MLGILLVAAALLMIGGGGHHVRPLLQGALSLFIGLALLWMVLAVIREFVRLHPLLTVFVVLGSIATVLFRAGLLGHKEENHGAPRERVATPSRGEHP